MSVEKRDAFRNQAQRVIDEAWNVGGGHGVTDDIEVQLRILNGLLAMALTEVAAKPAVGPFGSLAHLGEALRPAPEESA